jgi:hypothetical protein
MTPPQDVPQGEPLHVVLPRPPTLRVLLRLAPEEERPSGEADGDDHPIGGGMFGNTWPFAPRMANSADIMAPSAIAAVA